MKNFCFIIILFFSSLSCFSQTENEIFLESPAINPADSNSIFLHLYNSNFFKNNEYFNDFYEGYTLIGYILEPTAGIQLGTNSKIEAGIHLLKFSGRNNFNRIIPVFRMQQQACKGFDIILGTLYSSLNHELAEPLYEFDNYFFQHNENGLQFLINTSRLKSDIWIDWKEFILWGDPFQEVFLQGTSTKLNLSSSEKKLQINIPLQSIIVHHGGQINQNSQHIQTLANLAPGIELFYAGNQHVKKIGINAFYLYYKDLSPTPVTYYHEGQGIYPTLFINTSSWDISAGYWQGYKFIAPAGSYLLQSESFRNPSLSNAFRELITTNIMYGKTFASGIKLGIKAQTWLDVKTGILDYNYGIFMILNRDFHLLKGF